MWKNEHLGMAKLPKRTKIMGLHFPLHFRQKNHIKSNLPSDMFSKLRCLTSPQLRELRGEKRKIAEQIKWGNYRIAENAKNAEVT